MTSNEIDGWNGAIVSHLLSMEDELNASNRTFEKLLSLIHGQSSLPPSGSTAGTEGVGGTADSSTSLDNELLQNHATNNPNYGVLVASGISENAGEGSNLTALGSRERNPVAAFLNGRMTSNLLNRAGSAVGIDAPQGFHQPTQTARPPVSGGNVSRETSDELKLKQIFDLALGDQMAQLTADLQFNQNQDVDMSALGSSSKRPHLDCISAEGGQTQPTVLPGHPLKAALLDVQGNAQALEQDSQLTNKGTGPSIAELALSELLDPALAAAWAGYLDLQQSSEGRELGNTALDEKQLAIQDSLQRQRDVSGGGDLQHVVESCIKSRSARAHVGPFSVPDLSASQSAESILRQVANLQATPLLTSLSSRLSMADMGHLSSAVKEEPGVTQAALGAFQELAALDMPVTLGLAPHPPTLLGQIQDPTAGHALTFLPPQVALHGTGQHLQAGLLALAEALATHDQPSVRRLHENLRRESSVEGSPMQRIVCLVLRGLELRALGKGPQYVETLPKVPLEIQQAAFQEFVEHTPIFPLMAESATEMILHAVEGRAEVHIVGLWFMFCRWECLFRQLACRPEGPPRVRLTVVKLLSWFGPQYDAVTTGHAVESIARAAGVAFEWTAVESRLLELRPSLLQLRPQEALVVECGMALQRLPDASVIRSSPRDKILAMLHDLKPAVLTMTGINQQLNTPFFLARMANCLHVFHNVFDLLDAIFPRDNVNRQVIEASVFGEELVNCVACDGLDFWLRAESLDKWQSRAFAAGLAARPLPPAAILRLRQSLLKYPEGLALHEQGGSLHLDWRGKPLVWLSAFRQRQ